MSKKRPLLIVVHLANERETERALANINSSSFGYHQSRSYGDEDQKENDDRFDEDRDEHDDDSEPVRKKFLFKCGDDLRQDNLVL